MRAALPLLLLCLAIAAPLSADERILNYFADINVQQDGSIMVEETILVRAEGRSIQQGIYRDFPTRYRDRMGNRYTVDFELLEVRRNGNQEDWHSRKRSNGLRIYIGSEGRRLPEGEHEYLLRYRTSRQLGHFDTIDELYWNVTGTGWAFPIDRAGARVTLPGPVSAEGLQAAVYTGPQGSTGRAASWRKTGPATIEFQTTAPLGANEGLTIAVGWPPGLVARPGRVQETRNFFTDNGGTLVLLLGVLLVLAWYGWAWNKYGRDPRKGVIIPRFAAPKGLSPAACRYVLDMGLGRDAFTAAVVSLGVKGHLTIEEQKKAFTLRRREALDATAPSPGEQAILDALLPGAASRIVLENKQHAAFSKAQSGLKRALDKEYKNRLFRLNSWYMAPALGLSVLAAALAFPLPAGEAAWFIYIFASLGIHGLFLWLLRAPTPGGRVVMDEIEGFRMYLETGEQQRLDQMKSPTLTPEVFEQFLPYAFALGVENQWVTRFAAAFPELQSGENAYHPAWYSGNLRGSSLGRISSGLGSSLGSAIASSSTPPGSSSGSGGGGFSGGGGGGGGGGGW
jgi:uncharacterized membrane protein YgcG